MVAESHRSICPDAYLTTKNRSERNLGAGRRRVKEGSQERPDRYRDGLQHDLHPPPHAAAGGIRSSVPVRAPEGMERSDCAANLQSVTADRAGKRPSPPG